MINSLQNFGAANHLQSQATRYGVIQAIRTGNGQFLDPNHVKQSAENEASHSMQREEDERARRAAKDAEASYESIALRVEQARIAAEKSVEEETSVEAKPVVKTEQRPLEEEVKRGSRRARTAHQVAARYMMSVQGYETIASANQVNRVGSRPVDLQV